VPTAALLKALDIDLRPVDIDDGDHGADHGADLAAQVA
jgi:hypothetical protein